MNSWREIWIKMENRRLIMIIWGMIALTYSVYIVFYPTTPKMGCLFFPYPADYLIIIILYLIATLIYIIGEKDEI